MPAIHTARLVVRVLTDSTERGHEERAKALVREEVRSALPQVALEDDAPWTILVSVTERTETALSFRYMTLTIEVSQPGQDSLGRFDKVFWRDAILWGDTLPGYEASLNECVKKLVAVMAKEWRIENEWKRGRSMRGARDASSWPRR